MYVRFKNLEGILKDILSTPTSPFRENLVLKKIVQYLHDWGIDFIVTRYNNIIATLGKKGKRNDLFFISHTDHPGFLVEEEDTTKVIFRPMGGVPFQAKNFKSIAEIDRLTGQKYLHKVEKIIKMNNKK